MHSRLYIYIYNNVIRAHRVVVILMGVSMDRSCHVLDRKSDRSSELHRTVLSVSMWYY